ncbi:MULTISPECIES: TIGR04211 family SH3 domain-containing protein [Methylomicrobium]|uniref:SH3 domain protein n=1 Tax=Methylomicrobium album BG8 TaxID=686340 RepID=H8GKV2_METAL|nr:MULTISPECIES: TIGR04211 family SH3 domain-containing protein [Methylomicrobium]EIC29274.1 SH3 domain protein [Methylomicrobium album BG8]
MKRLLIASLLVVGAVHAAEPNKTVYVTDTHIIALRSEESNKGALVRSLETGTPLTVLEVSKKSGYSRVRLEDGTEGYILTRNTMKEPPSRTQLESATRESAALKSENAALKLELIKLKQFLTPGTTLEQSLAKERDKLIHELSELKKTSADAIRIKAERDNYEERYVQIEKEAKQLERENAALKDRSEQDWFLYGGMVASIGMILGFVLPKLSWRRKSSNWDTFY